MRFLRQFPLVLSALCATACADWQAELSPTEPGSFPPLRPSRAHYKFGWTAFTAADATFDYGKAKNGLMRMEVTARTTGFVRTLWRMDLRHVALTQASTFRPVSVRQSETYRNQLITTKLDFTPDEVTRLRENTPSDEKKPKLKHYEFPNLLDLHSALHWVRSQRLLPGDEYKFVVYPASTPYLAEVDVVERQKIKVAGRNWNAIKLDLKLWHIKDDLTLEPHSKFKKASVWTSDDANRVLLKIEAEIFVGSVWAELESIEWK